MLMTMILPIMIIMTMVWILIPADDYNVYDDGDAD